jgi:hypothetical protein
MIEQSVGRISQRVARMRARQTPRNPYRYAPDVADYAPSLF